MENISKLRGDNQPLTETNCLDRDQQGDEKLNSLE